MFSKTIFLLAVCFIAACSGKKSAEEAAVQKEIKEAKKLHNKYEAEPYVKRCPLGWQRLQNEKCFKLFLNETTHSLAEAACQEVGSTLASVVNETERNFVQSLVLKEIEIETNLTSLWTGLRRKANHYFWYDLSPYSLEETPFSTNEPSTLSGSDCGYIATDYDTFMNATIDFAKIKMADCNEPRGFLCQKVILDYCRSD